MSTHTGPKGPEDVPVGSLTIVGLPEGCLWCLKDLRLVWGVLHLRQLLSQRYRKLMKWARA